MDNTLFSTLTEEHLRLIKEHQAADDINTFFYKNKDAEKLMKETYDRHDRFTFVYMQRNIEEKFIPFAVALHGKKVKAMDSRGTEHVGTVKHLATKEFEGNTYTNEVDFHGGIPLLWVDVEDGHKMDSHLYPINRIQLID